MAPRDTPVQQSAPAVAFPAQVVAAPEKAQPEQLQQMQQQQPPPSALQNVGRMVAAVLFSNDPLPRAGVQQAIHTAIAAHPIIRAHSGEVKVDDAPRNVGLDSFTFHLRDELSRNTGAPHTLLISLLPDANDAVEGVFFNCSLSEIDAPSLKFLLENFVVAAFGVSALNEERVVIAVDRATVQQRFPGAIIAPDLLPLLRDEKHAAPLDEESTARRLAVTRELRKKTTQTKKYFSKLIKEERNARAALMKEERAELSAFVTALDQDRHEHSHQGKELRRFTKRIRKVEKDFSKHEKTLDSLAQETHKAKLADPESQRRVQEQEQEFRQLADNVHASNTKLAADETQLSHNATYEERFADMNAKEVNLVKTYSNETASEEKRLAKERKAAASHAKEGLHQEEKRLKSEEKAMEKQLKDAKKLRADQTKGNRLPVAGVQTTHLLSAAQLFPQQQFGGQAPAQKALPITLKGGSGDAIANACRVAAAVAISIAAQAHERGFLRNYYDSFEHIGFPVTIGVDLHEVLARGTPDTRLYQPSVGFVTVPVTFATTLFKSNTSAAAFTKAAQIDRTAGLLRSDLERRIARGEALRNALYPNIGNDAPLFRVLYLGAIAQAARHNIKCFFETSGSDAIMCWLGDRNVLNIAPASNFPLDAEVLRQHI